MRIIPVIDIKEGIVVHALQGQRNQYKELKSQLCYSPDVISVVLSLKSTFGFEELYVADLDGIMGKGINYDMINKLTNLSLFKIIVDSGVDNISKARNLINLGVSKVIIGTETLSDLNILKNILKTVGEEKIIISLDLKDDKIISKSDEITCFNVVKLAKMFEEMGIKEIITIDLNRVGSQQGVNLPLIRNLIKSTKIPIMVGGGIRNIEDLRILKAMGVSGALISSSFHNLRIKKEDLSCL